jgi:hypothetical protein
MRGGCHRSAAPLRRCLCRRLRRGVDQWGDATPRRHHEPGHYSGFQHSEPRRALRYRQGSDKFQIAILAINGPISVAPPKFCVVPPSLKQFDGFIGYFCDPSSLSNGERSFIRSNAHNACRMASVRSFGQRLPTLLRNFLSTSALLMGRSADPGA